MLYSELKDFGVKIPLGEKIGKFEGLVVDEKCNIKEIVVHPGILKESVIYDIKDVDEINEDEKEIVIKGNAAHNSLPEHSIRTKMFTEDLIDKKVISNDGEPVGKLYDFDITTNKIIGKLLISRGIKERRLRISPSKIKEVEEEIILAMNIDEL